MSIIQNGSFEQEVSKVAASFFAPAIRLVGVSERDLAVLVPRELLKREHLIQTADIKLLIDVILAQELILRNLIYYLPLESPLVHRSVLLLWRRWDASSSLGILTLK
jgi:hypothetical protein